MSETYAKQYDRVESPSRKAVEITPDDNNDLATWSKALYIGGGGNIEVQLVDDSGPTTFIAVPTGTVLPIRAKRIFSTGTTATFIVALL